MGAFGVKEHKEGGWKMGALAGGWRGRQEGVVVGV